ncbi:MAG: phosphate transport system regulatory protein PhoU [Candidatus Margulisbacteria bacterium GWF2_35_9]|nr:MAG: phosphate transport system regulatory protein PhoU [Candidatus Margulisbacteria bacterium GWF2_35_9]
MTRDNFHEKLDNTTLILLKMGELIEHLFDEIISILQTKIINKEMVETLIKEESQLDELEIEIENNCQEVLALQQPMGIDLRMILAVLKISSDLERIGDHLRKIIRKLRKVVNYKEYEHFTELTEMSIILRQMVMQIMVAFKEQNMKLALDTLELDEKIDEIQRDLYQKCIKKMKEQPLEQTISSEIYMLFITRFLERIGDHVENIGERVIFLVTGKLAN